MKILYHIGAMIVAGAIFLFVPLPPAHDDGLYHAPASYPELGGGYYFYTLDKSNDAQLDILAASLNDNNAITLLGSSELNDIKKNMPYQFFPETYRVPVVATGGGYYDAFGIHMTLQALQDSIKANAKIVIIVSSAWFISEQMFPHAFEKYIGGKIVRTVAMNGTRQGQADLKSYVRNHASDLNFEMAYGWAYACWQNICDKRTYHKYARKLDGVFTWVYNRPYQWRSLLLPPPHSDLSTHDTGIQPIYSLQKNKGLQQAIDWQNHFKDMQAQEVALHTNNTYDIRDDYYDIHIRGYVENGVTQRNLYTGMLNYQSEINALNSLLMFLREKQANAVFVMIPINPYFYGDVKRFNHLNDSIKSMVQGAGFPYYDMYTEPYENGTMADALHLGYYGWAKVNKFIKEAYYGR